jgi:hypothetical protein
MKSLILKPFKGVKSIIMKGSSANFITMKKRALITIRGLKVLALLKISRFRLSLLALSKTVVDNQLIL